MTEARATMYHYTESGLQNIWLSNGFHKKRVPGGIAVSIDDADGLHSSIGRALVMRPHLTGADLRFLRKALGLSQTRLGELVGASEESVSLWERRGTMPKSADRLVRAIYLEKLDGPVRIAEMIERLLALDSPAEEELVLEHTTTGWKIAA